MIVQLIIQDCNYWVLWGELWPLFPLLSVHYLSFCLLDTEEPARKKPRKHIPTDDEARAAYVEMLQATTETERVKAETYKLAQEALRLAIGLMQRGETSSVFPLV